MTRATAWALLETPSFVIAFLTWLAEAIGDDSRFVHLGLTSSDVLDTCLSVQLTQAADMLDRGDIADRYEEALFSSGEQDPHLGLLEVAVDYRAKIRIAPAGEHLTLSAEMTLEGAQ